jgi:Carboxypeptidase regulatory-like domain/TonB dependent receptor-like, beta-barrel
MRLVSLIRRNLRGVLLIVVVAAAPAVVAAQGAANIRGSVFTIGQDGKPVYLPGAQVSLSCRPGPPKPQTIASDETGRFSLAGIAPGECTVTATMAGFEPAVKMVTVAANAQVEVDLELSLASVEQKVTVTGAPPAGVDVSITSTAAPAIVQKQLQLAPLVNEKFQDALPLIPGVVRGPDGLIDVKGARPSESATLVNSASAVDPVTGQAAISLPIEAVESVKILPDPFSAQYGRFVGGVTQVETRSGTDQWKVLFTDFFPRLRRREDHWAGIGSITPRLTFAGPLVKDKLFFFQSFDYRFIRTEVRVDQLPPLQRDQVFETFNSQTQFDWEINPRHHFTASFTLYPENLSFVNLNTFNPESTTPDLHQRGYQMTFNERAILGGSVLESLVSVKRYDVHVWPSAGQFGVLDLFPEQNFGDWFDKQDRNSWLEEVSQTYHLGTLKGAGEHLVEFGYDLVHSNYDGFVTNQPVQILREDRTLSQLIQFTAPAPLSATKTDLALFVQDHWQVVPRFTLDIGLRADHDGLANDALNVAPRLGFVVAPTSDNKTALRGGIGLFYDKIPLDLAPFTAYPAEIVTEFAADGTTVVGLPTTFTHVLLAPGGRKLPYSVVWNAQVDRQLTHSLMFRFGYEERKTHRSFFLQPASGPASGAGSLLLLNSGRESYREFQWTARWQAAERTQLFASFVHSRAKGELNNFEQFFGNLPYPVIRPNEFGPLPFDSPNRFLLWGSIGLPWKLDFWPVLDVHSGFPFSKVDNDLNFIGPRNQAGRFPAFFSFDFQLTREFRVPFMGKKRTMRTGVKIFNVTNHFNPRDVQENIFSPVFGGFYNSVGRLYRAKLEFNF